MCWGLGLLPHLEVNTTTGFSVSNFHSLGAAYLNRTVMSYHYYCWALGYSSDNEVDPILTTVCDDVSIEQHNLVPNIFDILDSWTHGVQYS